MHKVQRLFGKKKAAPASDASHVIAEPAAAEPEPAEPAVPEGDAVEQQTPAPQQYYTYDASAKESVDE